MLSPDIIRGPKPIDLTIDPRLDSPHYDHRYPDRIEFKPNRPSLEELNARPLRSTIRSNVPQA